MNKKLDKPLEGFFALYKLSLQFENKSPATLSIYFRNLHQFHTWLAGALGRSPLLADLTIPNVQAYVAHLRTKKLWDNNAFVPTHDGHLSPFTIVCHVRTLKGFSTWLYEENYTHENVLKRLPLPKLPKLLAEPLTEHEIQKIFASLNTKTKTGARDYAMVLLFLDTGIRCSELCRLRLDDVHLETEPGWIKVYGKGDKERIVVLGRAAHHALLTYKMFVRKTTVTDAFFVGWMGHQMTVNTVEKAMDRIAKQAGIPRVRLHLLRHTAATQYLVAGGDAISLQQKLGHSTLTMISHYVHLASQHLAAIRERVSPMDRVKIAPLRHPHRRAKRQ